MEEGASVGLNLDNQSNQNIITDLIDVINSDDGKKYFCKWKWYEIDKYPYLWYGLNIGINIIIILLTIFYEDVKIAYDIVYNLLILFIYPIIINRFKIFISDNSEAQEVSEIGMEISRKTNLFKYSFSEKMTKLIEEIIDVIIFIRILGTITSIYGLVKSAISEDKFVEVIEWAETAQHLYYQYIYDYYLVIAIFVIGSFVVDMKCLKNKVGIKWWRILISVIAYCYFIGTVIAGISLAVILSPDNVFKVYNEWFTYSFCGFFLLKPWTYL